MFRREDFRLVADEASEESNGGNVRLDIFTVEHTLNWYHGIDDLFYAST
jgi:hypothetical protein